MEELVGCLDAYTLQYYYWLGITYYKNDKRLLSAPSIKPNFVMAHPKKILDTFEKRWKETSDVGDKE
jgi:hypothetical protein